MKKLKFVSASRTDCFLTFPCISNRQKDKNTSKIANLYSAYRVIRGSRASPSRSVTLQSKDSSSPSALLSPSPVEGARGRGGQQVFDC
jgi:hypothetical protein